MPTSSRPNILLIMSDQHNPHVAGFEGNRVVKTPALDALAAQGVRFSAAYCPSPLCVPSRAAFMTGKYPSRIDCFDNGGIIPPDVPTFAHALSDAGYETVLCGRMHFEGPDQFHGFDKRLAGDCMHWLTEETRGAPGASRDGQTAPAAQVAGFGRTGYEAYDAFIASKSLEFLRKKVPGTFFSRRNQCGINGLGTTEKVPGTFSVAEKKPFCLVVGMMLPHNPLIARKDLFEYYLSRVKPEMPTAEEIAKLHPAIRAWRTRRGADKITPEQARRALAAYYALVTEMDENVGKVVAAARKADPECVVIYTTDHGDMASEHGMWWKSCFFEGSARVPLVVSGFGRAGIPACHSPRADKNVCPTEKDGGAGIPACHVVDSVVSLLDLAPTLLDLAGGKPMKDIDGRSLVPFLRSLGKTRDKGETPADWPNEAFSEYGGAHGDKPSCMVRAGDWKFMYYSEFDSGLLFNLREDPKERHDVARDPACAAVVEELRAKVLSRWSAKAVSDGMERQRLARLAGPKPPWPAAWESPPPDANRFDPPSPSGGGLG